MEDIQHFQILAQLIGNMLAASEKLEKSYDNKNAETFRKAREEILNIQNKISRIVK